ncbi:MAG: Zn-ribbon domain-containing OB-fold protein [Candidatus Heimdallarchaeota archaeon]
MSLGMHSFIVESKASKFIKGLQNGRIETTRCIKCDRTFFPPRADCSYCYDSGIQWFEVKSREGILKTFTTVMVAPQEFSEHSPYCVGIVELPEGISIMGWIKEAEDSLLVGDRLKIAIESNRERSMIYFEKI